MKTCSRYRSMSDADPPRTAGTSNTRPRAGPINVGRRGYEPITSERGRLVSFSSLGLGAGRVLASHASCRDQHLRADGRHRGGLVLQTGDGGSSLPRGHVVPFVHARHVHAVREDGWRGAVVGDDRDRALRGGHAAPCCVRFDDHEPKQKQALRTSSLAGVLPTDRKFSWVLRQQQAAFQLPQCLPQNERLTLRDVAGHRNFYINIVDLPVHRRTLTERLWRQILPRLDLIRKRTSRESVREMSTGGKIASCDSGNRLYLRSRCSSS